MHLRQDSYRWPYSEESNFSSSQLPLSTSDFDYEFALDDSIKPLMPSPAFSYDESFTGFQDFAPQGYSPFDESIQSSGFIQPALNSEHAWTPSSDYSQSIQQHNTFLHPQQSNRFHRRALSNSSSVSQGSLSPYSPHLQYPAAYNSSKGSLGPAWDDNQYQSSDSNHLPTPTHTPTRDSFIDQRAQRRVQANVKAQAAMNAQQHMRGSASRQQSQTRAPAPTSRPSGLSTFGSTYGQELPQTPKSVNGDESEGQYNANAMRHVPTFDRTMSDIYQDELWDPRSTGTMQAPKPVQQYDTSSFLAPQNAVSERLQAANQARSASPQVQRHDSPFRQRDFGQGPMLSATSTDFPPNSGPLQSQSQQRQDQKYGQAERQHREYYNRQLNNQPQTVSPKDAFPEAQPLKKEDTMPSLFPENSDSNNMSQGGSFGSHVGSQNGFQYALPTSSFSFATPSIPASAQADFAKSAQQYRPESSDSDVQSETPHFPPQLPSMETTRSEEDVEDESTSDSEVQRPSNTIAGSGTYTCTYHGCARRFESPARLQKHKREDHRATATHTQPEGLGMTQAGPHKCERINPSTGKPCNTEFSRPYDLTRHEDTIHAERKKVRCEFCTEEKTFSRADALTRHLRVVHPNVSFPGKSRRRHM